MARGLMEFLSKEDIERIQRISTRVLEKVGVVVLCESTRDVLVNAGATMSKQNGRVLIPRDLVKQSLASAPKSVLLASRDGRHDIRVPSEERMYVSCGGEGVYVKDMLTGETRPSTGADVRDFTIIVDTLPQIDFAWVMVGALEEPAHLKDLAGMRIMFEATTKHIQSNASSTREARAMVDVAAVLTGGEKELAKKPIVSMVQCPISPLTFEKGLTEAQVAFAEAGVPVVAMAAAVAGLTSPVTLAGTLAQVNAENLASLVISQTAKKGAPWIYSSDSCPGDLKTGSIDYGSFEALLLRAGAAQLGAAYGLPTMSGGVGLEASSIAYGSLEDAVSTMILQGLTPSDLGSGFGGVDQAAGGSYEQMILDAWVWDVAREFSRPFAMDEEAISFETIRDAGIDGNFLGKRHTLSRFKKEFTATVKPEAVISGRASSDKRGDLLRKAKAEAESILRKPKVPKISKDESRRIFDVIHEFAEHVE